MPAPATFPLDVPAHADLLTLAPIVPGANVSRPVVDHPTGKLILFAMDTDQAISAHSAPWPALVQVLEGELAVEVGDQRYTVAQHGWVLMPKGVPHALRALKPTRWMLTLMKAAA